MPSVEPDPSQSSMQVAAPAPSCDVVTSETCDFEWFQHRARRRCWLRRRVGTWSESERIPACVPQPCIERGPNSAAAAATRRNRARRVVAMRRESLTMSILGSC